MNIFAIDLGNKRIKMKSDRGEYVYPASYLNAETITTGGLGDLTIANNQVYAMDNDGDNQFIWGTELEAYNLPEKMIDTYARSGRMKQKKAKRILEFALGRLAFDYKESRTKPLTINLMLGVPITDMHRDSETIDLLKTLMIGRHYIRVNDEELIVEIPSEDYISIIPQYMGTVLNLAFDEALHPVETYTNGRIGILDIGGGTILVNTSNRMNPSPIGEERFEGVQTLIKSIAQKINSTKTFKIENLIRHKTEEDRYIYRPNRNQADSRDITDIVEKSLENYTRFTVAPLITEFFPDIEEADFIVITGGGANVLDKSALLDEIGKDYFERLLFMEESEMANVRGFYKGALLTWSTPREQSTPATQKGEITKTKPTHSEKPSSDPIKENKTYSDQLKKVQENLKKLKEEIKNEII